jgi:hypothetical protein
MWINFKKYLNVQFATLYRYVLSVKNFADLRFKPTVLSSRLVRGQDGIVLKTEAPTGYH